MDGGVLPSGEGAKSVSDTLSIRDFEDRMENINNSFVLVG